MKTVYIYNYDTITLIDDVLCTTRKQDAYCIGKIIVEDYITTVSFGRIIHYNIVTITEKPKQLFLQESKEALIKQYPNFTPIVFDPMIKNKRNPTKNRNIYCIMLESLEEEQDQVEENTFYVYFENEPIVDTFISIDSLYRYLSFQTEYL
jgi:hypothetical protein